MSKVKSDMETLAADYADDISHQTVESMQRMSLEVDSKLKTIQELNVVDSTSDVKARSNLHEVKSPNRQAASQVRCGYG